MSGLLKLLLRLKAIIAVVNFLLLSLWFAPRVAFNLFAKLRTSLVLTSVRIRWLGLISKGAGSSRESFVNFSWGRLVTSLIQHLVWLVTVVSIINLFLCSLGLTPGVADDIFTKLLATIILAWTKLSCGQSPLVNVWSICFTHESGAGAWPYESLRNINVVLTWSDLSLSAHFSCWKGRFQFLLRSARHRGRFSTVSGS